MGCRTATKLLVAMGSKLLLGEYRIDDLCLEAFQITSERCSACVIYDKDTFAQRDALKEAGFHWVPKHRVWVRVETSDEANLEDLLTTAVVCVEDGRIKDNLGTCYDHRSTLKSQKITFKRKGEWCPQVLRGQWIEWSKKGAAHLACGKEKAECDKLKRGKEKSIRAQRSGAEEAEDMDAIFHAVDRHVDNLRRRMIAQGILYDGGPRILVGPPPGLPRVPLCWGEDSPVSMYNDTEAFMVPSNVVDSMYGVTIGLTRDDFEDEGSFREAISAHGR